MSEKADRVVKEMKEMGWEDIYDNEAMKIETYNKKSRLKYYTQVWSAKWIDENDIVLDVGCGNGELCGYAEDKGCKRVVAYDVSQEALNKAKEYTNPKIVEFIKGYAEKLPFEDKTFTVVTCNQVLEHLKDDDLVIGEMLRVLKKNGKLIITVPIGNELDGKDNNSKHLNKYDYNNVLRKFQVLGDDFTISMIPKFKDKNVQGVHKLTNRINCFGIVHNKR